LSIRAEEISASILAWMNRMLKESAFMATLGSVSMARPSTVPPP
jgi:hypothetical protein